MKVGVALLLMAAACGPADRPSVAVPKIPPGPPVARDSMVLAVSGGRSVWLAEGRDAHDAAGMACFERSVEIRTATGRTKVPLLFVRTGPTLLDPARLRAELSRDCRVMAIYSVELATGRPVKLEDR